jgi:hypothetical protein
MDKLTPIVVQALKQAMAEPAEQRLFRSGKQPGLFALRTGVHAEAAAQALRDGLLDVVRTETKGKSTVEWVRPSPRGVHFVHEHESPIRALEEMRDVLQVTRQGVPVWLAELRRELQALTGRLTEEAQRWSHRLDTLSRRVEEALRRAEAAKSAPVNGPAAAIPWAVEALAYLDDRREGGAPAPCSLPELFAALRQTHAELSMTNFHEGLKRLHERHALRLLPFAGAPSDLPEPEYALLEGPIVFYYAAR